MKMPRIIAVDFDGTCVDHRYPDVGADAPQAVKVLQVLSGVMGVKLILWTMRSGDKLADAAAWFSAREIPLFGINCNPEQLTWTSSPKAYAQLYIDDAAFGAPLIEPASFHRPCVDWDAVARTLIPKEMQP